MNEMELKQLWLSANEKLEKGLDLIQGQKEDIAILKTKSFMSSMKPLKMFTIVAGSLWVIIVGNILVNLVIYAPGKVSVFFLVSASGQVLITAIALIMYLYQLVTIYQIDTTETIVKTQARLARLKASTLWVTRILFLQLPFWTTFYWNENMIENGNVSLWTFQALVTLLFTCAAVWLFINIRYENSEKKWFRMLFNGSEWGSIFKSLALLDEVRKYEADENS